MSRPLRIEYEGAWYHVMNRGRRRESIFLDDLDYRIFLRLVRQCAELWRARIAAYCLMPNHYHLLMQTPLGNLARCMRHIDGVYAQTFNRRHDCDGQLFRGRYRSILVDADRYLLHLVRYIHRNPLEAGVSSSLGGYRWSSHGVYVAGGRRGQWLVADRILSQFGSVRSKAVRSYLAFVRQENSAEIARFYGAKNIRPILGSSDFLDWVKRGFYSERLHEEVPESQVLVPSSEKIVDLVSARYGIETSEIIGCSKGPGLEAKAVAMYLVRKLTAQKLRSIAFRFGLKRHGSVTRCIGRLRKQAANDRELRRFLGDLEKQARMVDAST
jgi:putative transposase